MKKTLSKMLIMLVISYNLLVPTIYMERPELSQSGYTDITTFDQADELPKIPIEPDPKKIEKNI